MTRPASSNREIECLGSVCCPSGILIILDGGLAWMWSHDRTPLLPEGMDIATMAAASRELSVSGPDAHAAGLAFDRSPHPLYIFDQPADSHESLRLAFDTFVNGRGL